MIPTRSLALQSVPILLACAGAAYAQEEQSAQYKAGYEAGYRAALASLHAGAPVAAPATAAAPPPAAGAQTPGPDWWNHSALRYPKQEAPWRHHVQWQISATGLSGNDAGHAYRGGGTLTSRTGRWTNELQASVDKRSIVQSGGSLNERDTDMLQDSIRYDLDASLYAAAGVILERDDVNYIDHRETVLGGAGYYVLDNKAVRLNLFGALGQMRETYLDPVPGLVGVAARSSGLLYLYQTLDWQLAPQWSLQQGLRQIRDLNAAGVFVPDPARPGLYYAPSDTRRYRTLATVSLNYALSPRSMISFGVETRYDSNPWPDVKPRDTTRRINFVFVH
jgi:hypothetical protein